MDKQKLSETGSSAKDIRAALELVRSVRNTMTFLKALTPDERVSLPRVRTSSLQSMEDALQAARDNPSILPVRMPLEHLENEVQSCQDLHGILTQLEELCSDVRDTLRWHATDANASAGHVRILVKAAARTKPMPGMQLLSHRLSPRRRNAKAAVTANTLLANVPTPVAANPETLQSAPAPVDVARSTPTGASGAEPKAA